MKRISIVSLVAAIAVAMATAASASAALPEFSPATPQKFTSKSGKVTLLTTGKGKAKVTCLASTDEGGIAGPQNGTVTIKFTGCNTFGLTCTSPGAAEGEITTTPLTMTLGYVNAANKEVGIDLEPAGNGFFAIFLCPAHGVLYEVKGSLIGALKRVNTVVTPPKTFSLGFARARLKQKITHFEGGPNDTLEMAAGSEPFEPATLITSDKLTFESPLEVKA